MKREHIQFLVTCSIGYDEHTSRREAIAQARENLFAVRTVHTAEVKRAVLVKPGSLPPDSQAYFYTYALPRYHGGSPGAFTYWRVKDADEALGLAVSRYGHPQFHIEQTDAASYRAAKEKGN